MLSQTCFEHLLPAEPPPPTTPNVNWTSKCAYFHSGSHLKHSANVTVPFMPGEHDTSLSLDAVSSVVFCAGTPLIGARTWTECSTSMQATGQCTSSGSWTEKRTPGTTSPSLPQSSVSAADISVQPLLVVDPADCCLLKWKVLEQPVLAGIWDLLPSLRSTQLFQILKTQPEPLFDQALIWNRSILDSF